MKRIGLWFFRFRKVVRYLLVRKPAIVKRAGDTGDEKELQEEKYKKSV